ncbi:hypothetical protein UA08_05241 [Talaromyces atroroseus]|uniref:Zn(2)-C6 fungal-type domain-containing protein n=1 Tax=Talaromyces atroroseus TaxID=1441469 RepID=A0A225AXC6_TALAT|nr:hypothetical protein UA08_05241 [Talaromyces atroroseus]OKL59636.1 hypothetical protein UA08_05241 [Talaromyces atroroseus]
MPTSPPSTSATAQNGGLLPTTNSYALNAPQSESLSMRVSGSRTQTVDRKSDFYRFRACDTCRSLKVRCEPHPNPSVESCYKCANLGRTCVITPPNRKRRKRTDTRVAELEAKIDGLVNSLRASGSEPQHGLHGSESYKISTPNDACEKTHFTGHSESSSTDQPCCCGHNSTQRHHQVDNTQSRSVLSVAQCGSSLEKGIEYTASEITSDRGPDALDCGIVDLASVEAAFHRYVSEISLILPIVIFPPETKMEDLRAKKPILFWAIIAVSIDTINPSVHPLLIQQTYRTFGKLIFMRGQKSLELLQALVVCCQWYKLPERLEELNVYQLVHSGVAMAMDLGLNKHAPRMTLPLRSVQDFNRYNSMPNHHDAMEARRTWLGVYFLSVQVSSSLKRVFLVRWNQYMDDCIEVLERSSQYFPSDTILIHWIRLAHIMEQVGTQFSIDDGSAGFKLEDSRVQYSLKAYEKVLQRWHQGTANLALSRIQKVIFEQSIHLVRIFMHESALHFELDDIISRQITGRGSVDTRSAERINSLIICVTSVHKALDAAFCLQIEDILAIPGIVTARIGCCAIILIKLSVMVSTPENQIRAIYDVPDLRAEHYVDKCEEWLRRVGSLKGGRSFSHVEKIINSLNLWFVKPGGTRLPIEKAVAILSLPRHVTSVIGDLFQMTAQEQKEQEIRSIKQAQPSGNITDPSPVWKTATVDNLAQEPRQSLHNAPPAYTSNYSSEKPKPCALTPTPAGPTGPETHLDMEQIYHLGALLDNNFLQMPSSIDDFMGFF